MAYTTLIQLKNELLGFLRNQDIISVATRGVTTDTYAETLASASSALINRINVKNIRSVTVAAVALSFGTDYTYDLDFDDSGTKKAKITFISAQTGALSVSYDYGSNDKIYPDYPKPYIKRSDFPRIGFDIIAGATREVEIGAGSNESRYTLSITGYSTKQTELEDLISDIREKLMSNKKNFFYVTFITPNVMGPLIPSPYGENKILQRNQDFDIMYIFEQ